MDILIVGNILDDVYLNLDNRTEHYETDRHGVKWLDLSFNASEHHYYNRNSSLGGAAVTLEVLQKLGLSAAISGSTLNFTNETTLPDQDTHVHRYILINDDAVTYFAPSKFQTTEFIPPSEPTDYLYLDRSATLNQETATKIASFLDSSPDTQLILYVQNFNNPYLNALLPRANLVFCENYAKLQVSSSPALTSIKSLNPSIVLDISESHLTCDNITEPISINRIHMLTHLSAHSITSATILGSFIQGKSIEDSLKLARLNAENSRLDATLTSEELANLADQSDGQDNLELIATNLVLKPKGILAADESGGSIKKKFAQLNIPDTPETRRDYRNIFFTTPGLEKYVNGVILYDETARQIANNGQNFTDYLTAKCIIPGIKTDQGLVKFGDSTPDNYPSDAPAHPEETWTKGLDDLSQRLQEYYKMGLRFAKWRAAFEIRLGENGEILTPTNTAIDINCQILADYAQKCQENNIVPICEPEVVYDGNYSAVQNSEITSKICDHLFQKLSERGVNLRACILKINMVLAGKQQENQSTPEEVGAITAETLKNHVPSELAGVVFLSGGQTTEQATDNLAAVIKNGPFPWPVTFSFARALQDPALFAWQGDNQNNGKARQAFADRLIANTRALQ